MPEKLKNKIVQLWIVHLLEHYGSQEKESSQEDERNSLTSPFGQPPHE